MSGQYSILIVGNNEAFATVLKESLEQDERYRVTMVTGGEGLQALAAHEFSLAIVDLGLEDPDGATFVRQLRQQKASLRLMLIPIDGDKLPPELSDVEVQGILAAPFFFPELPDQVARALAVSFDGRAAALSQAPTDVEVEEPAAAADEPVAPRVERPIVLFGGDPKITHGMTALAQEVNAEAVLLTRAGELMAHTGRLSADKVTGLALAVADNWQTASRVGDILGREQAHFEQSTEGGEYLFYSVAVLADVVLSVALSANVPLGMLRHRVKEAADGLRALVSVY